MTAPRKPTAADVGTARGAKPSWLAEILGVPALPPEAGSIVLDGTCFLMRDGVLRSEMVVSAAQAQTASSFGYQWRKRELYERPKVRSEARRWLIERYGDMERARWLRFDGEPKILLDAGCGAGFSALELFGPVLDRIRYLGVDISEAVDVAKLRLSGHAGDAAFLQADVTRLPLRSRSVDVIFSEGVLHHTDSTERAFKSLVPLLKPGGRFLFYVYRKKGSIREFTDDYVREQLQGMTPEEAWNSLLPLTKLGKAIGDLNAEIEVPEPVPLLGIPAGRMSVQRLFYWHVFKAYYRPDWTVEQMNNVNFDWYSPRNAHRHTPEEIRAWCHESGMEIERERVEEAGITMVARKTDA